MPVKPQISLPEDRAERAARRLVYRWLADYAESMRQRELADARMREIADGMELVIHALPPEERQQAKRKFEQVQRGQPTGRATELYENVVELLQQDNRREWRIPALRHALEKRHSSPPDDKALYNVINYLERTGRLQRVARGRYVVRDSGMELEFEDRDDGTIRRSENDD